MVTLQRSAMTKVLSQASEMSLKISRISAAVLKWTSGV